MEQPSSSPTSLGDEDADDEQQQLPQQLPQLQQQQAGYTDLDLAVDVAQLNARLRNGDFKRWWQDLNPPVVFSLGQQQYSPAGTCIVTSINAFLQAEARRYTAAGTVSTRRERLSDLLGIRSRQVFLDKATKGGWVLLARQHGVQLADLTPLQPLFERLERPSLSLTHTWPTPQADEAVVQVLQVAAANVPEGVLAARTGSKAVTAAIDTLQAGGISGFRAPRVRGAGAQHSVSRQRRRHQQQEQQQQRQEEPAHPQQQQQQHLDQQPAPQQIGQQQLPLLVLLNQQLQHMTLPMQQQQQQQQQLSMLMLLSQQQQQLTQLVQPGIAMHVGDGTAKDLQEGAGQQPQQAQQQQHQQLYQLHQQNHQQPHPQQQQHQQQQCTEQKHVLQLEQQHSKRHKHDAIEGAEHGRTPASAAGAAGAAAAGAGSDSTATADAASGSADSQQGNAPWQDAATAAAAAAAAAAPADAACQNTSPAAQTDAPRQCAAAQQQPGPAHVYSPGSHKRGMQVTLVNTQQQLNSTPASPAGAGRGRDHELLWRYERAQLAYDATVAAAVAGETESAAAAAAAAAAGVPGAFVLPWAQRQPWEWEWEQRQPASPRATAAADILMLLAGDRLRV